MTKPYQRSLTLFVVSALCFLSLVQSKDAHKGEATSNTKEAPKIEVSSSVPGPSAGGPDAEFFVQGQVYCDTCRAQFITKVSQFMPGKRYTHKLKMCSWCNSFV